MSSESVVDQEYQNIPDSEDENRLVSSLAARQVIENIETNVTVLRTAGRTLGVSSSGRICLGGKLSKIFNEMRSVGHGPSQYMTRKERGSINGVQHLCVTPTIS